MSTSKSISYSFLSRSTSSTRTSISTDSSRRPQQYADIAHMRTSQLEKTEGADCVPREQAPVSFDSFLGLPRTAAAGKPSAASAGRGTPRTSKAPVAIAHPAGDVRAVSPDELDVIAPSSNGQLTPEEIKEREMRKDLQVDQVLKLIGQLERVDLCFVVDCTGSMQPWIAGVRDSIKGIVDDVVSVHRNAKLRSAFVRYTDFDQGTKATSALDFTSRTEKFLSFVNAITAHGGDDAAEDVMSGLEQALDNLSWRDRSTRVLVHIADCPAHGSQFHAAHVGDKHPRGDPKGRTAAMMMQKVNAGKIQYFFGYIKKEVTNQMIQVFNSELESLPNLQVPLIEQFDVQRPAAIRSAVATSIIESITSSISLASHIVDNGGKDISDTVVVPKRAVKFDSSAPDWDDTDKSFTANFSMHRFDLPSDVSDIIGPSWSLRRKQKKIIKLQVQKAAFAQGGVRVVYHAKIIGDDIDNTHMVIKMNKRVGTADNSLKQYLLDMETQSVAAFFAQKFCETVKNKSRNQTLNVWLPQLIVQKVVRTNLSSVMNAAMEPFIDGLDYAKFNNNAGGVFGSDHISECMQAFSHFTWVYSRKQHLVVDVQGFIDHKQHKVRLTDPAIHSENKLKFGGTNFGVKGMDKFFETHRCGPTCVALGLTK